MLCDPWILRAHFFSQTLWNPVPETLPDIGVNSGLWALLTKFPTRALEGSSRAVKHFSQQALAPS